ncbi:MAG: iron-containing alcohol dehydrogenase [Actinomycetota bacterium]|nr:iron-containing alcohol dehydrogenase [Actinomycetota bacterium]
MRNREGFVAKKNASVYGSPTAPVPSPSMPPSTTLRVLNVPRVKVSGWLGELSSASSKFGGWLLRRGYERPFVIGSERAQALVSSLSDIAGWELPAKDATQGWAASLGPVIQRSGGDVIVAIGGGRCLDIAKLAAAGSGLPLIAVPTQLSHDGICSPVAVIPKDGGIPESVEAVAPFAAFFSLPILANQPLSSIRAGLGDLISNPLALRDWELAASRGLEDIDEGAWHLSVESFHLIERLLASDLEEEVRDPRMMGLLAHALANSGLAMISAGSSRPASGAEHKISHAIDHLFGPRALHGAQVAFGSLISVAMYALDVEEFRVQLAHLGLPHHPKHLGLSERDLVTILLAAPEMRPGRFTILEQHALDERSATKLIRSIW